MRTVVVRRGDTLAAIAARTLGSSARWPAIYSANRGKIRNPGAIYPGQVLVLPRR
jgi:nucleoid-associated protein YgaU